MAYTRLNPDTATKTSGVFTAASGITASAQAFTRNGKVAQLELYIKHTSAWTVGTQYNIGTVASGYRPAENSGGIIGTYGVAALLTGGQVYVRPLNNTELGAGDSSYVRFTYILA